MVSDEPGYYQTGAYGIRIENLLYVREQEQKAGGKAFYGFEVLTLAPIDLNLVDKSMLDPAETEWLNSYHRRVTETLSPMLDTGTRAWLKNAARAI